MPAVPAPSKGADERDDSRAWGVGNVFGGRFLLEALLGRGGMGAVYRVLDYGDGRRKALKLLHAFVTEGVDGEDRFRREVELLARVRHPAVPAVHAWGTAEGRSYYVSDLVEGRELASEIHQVGRIPPREAVRIVAEIADALHAVHLAGVVHRDVKPQNVMLDGRGHVHLLDFGIARSVSRDTRALTGTGMTLGTPEYMSPEQFEGSKVDARSDVYSLGVILFEMLSGQVPFTGDSPFALALRQRTETARDVRSLQPTVPSWLSRIVATCLERDRERRFGSADQLAAALRKDWSERSVRTRHLRTGDFVREEDPAVTGFSLVLESRTEKDRWTAGMALHFESRHYRLIDLIPPLRPTEPWVYRFVQWPDREILRTVVDYEADYEARRASEDGTFFGRLRRALQSAPRGR